MLEQVNVYNQLAHVSAAVFARKQKVTELSPATVHCASTRKINSTLTV